MILSVRLDVWLSGGRERRAGSSAWRWLANAIVTGTGESLAVEEAMEASKLESAVREAVATAASSTSENQHQSLSFDKLRTNGEEKPTHPVVLDEYVHGGTNGAKEPSMSQAPQAGPIAVEVSSGSVRIGVAGRCRATHHPLQSAVSVELSAFDVALSRQPGESLATWDRRLQMAAENAESLKTMVDRLDRAASECLRGLERALRRALPVARLKRRARMQPLPRGPVRRLSNPDGSDDHDAFGFAEATVDMLEALAARPQVPMIEDWGGGGFDSLGGEESFDTGGGGFTDGPAGDSGGGQY